MTFFAQLNPARYLVGRLFLWFWATFIVIALITFYANQLLESRVEVRSPSKREVSVLQRAVEKVNQLLMEETALPNALDDVSRQLHRRVFVLNSETATIIRGDRPPLSIDEQNELLQVASQASPLTISRRGFQTVGPAIFNYHQSQYSLFISRPERPPDRQTTLFYFFGFGIIITLVLAYIFARSLVNPIHELQQSSRTLAGGQWGTRADKPALRKDELGELARDFNRMASQLENLWQGQQRLLADISHELRSPLARLQMALGLAHQQNVDAKTLARIEREAERMETLIHQLLLLTRAEATEEAFEAVTIPAFLETVFADAKFEATNKGKQLHVDAAVSFAAQVNKTMLCRAVENVIRNAIHYASSAVKVKIAVTDLQWQIEIEDDGEGLPESDCEAIFAPFYRTSLSRERESGGVGLGLAIAKAAVQLHHGRIQAARSPMGGLAVTMIFPSFDK